MNFFVQVNPTIVGAAIEAAITESYLPGVRAPKAPSRRLLRIGKNDVEKIPRKIPHTRSTAINQTDSKQHDSLKFQDSINQDNTAQQYESRS